MSKRALPLAVLLSAIIGCGGGGADRRSDARQILDEGGGAATPPAPDAGRTRARVRTDGRSREPRTAAPSIRIVTPTSGEAVGGGAVTVRVAIAGFQVVDQRVRPPFPRPVVGKGHVHFYLNTERLPREHSPPATGVYRSISASSYTWTGLEPGIHSLAAQLVGKDHAPLRPGVSDRVAVNVTLR